MHERDIGHPLFSECGRAHDVQWATSSKEYISIPLDSANLTESSVNPDATMSIPSVVRVGVLTPPQCADIAAGPPQRLGTYILEHMTQIFRHGSRQPLVYTIVVPLAHLHVARIDGSEEGTGIILLILKTVLLESVDRRHITFPSDDCIEKPIKTTMVRIQDYIHGIDEKV